MTTYPNGLASRAQLAAEIAEAIRKLPEDEVAHVAYRVRPDSTDEPAIFFKATPRDAASGERVIGEVSRRVEAAVVESIHPQENRGLFPYFNFRSETDERRRPDPEWI